MMRLMSSISSTLDSVTESTRLRYELNYPQKLWITGTAKIHVVLRDKQNPFDFNLLQHV
jgi:hypothetical protein